MITFTDRSPMPFGEFGPTGGNPKSLEEVPASYLLWLWESGQLWNQEKLESSFKLAHQKRDAAMIKKAEEWIALHNYIAANFTKLEIASGILTDVTVQHRPKLRAALNGGT